MSRAGVRRLIYQRLLDGDKLKLQERSNISQTGGGARDARLRPWEKFEPIVRRMCPRTEIKTTTRAGQRVEVEIFKADLRWYEEGELKDHEVEFWPPQPKRPGEGRLSKTPQIPPFSVDKLPDEEAGTVFYFIWEDDEGLWARWLSERELRSGEWAEELSQTVLDALQAAGERNVRGFIDFESGERESFHS